MTPASEPSQPSLTEKLFAQLENNAWEQAESLLETLVWLLYARWLETHSGFYGRADCDKRWTFWRELGLRVRYRHLQQIVYPFLQIHAPMTGHLLGLILPTVPFSIPDARALRELLTLIENHTPQALCEAMLSLVDIDEPAGYGLEEAVQLLQPQASSIIWEPYCRSGRFLAACARRLRRQHWQSLGLTPERLLHFRHGQFFGRVRRRSEALLSAFNLLLADQPAARLDGYSVPWPRPDLIWASGIESEQSAEDLLELLAPEGRLVLWHAGKRRGASPLNTGGSLEILTQPLSRVGESHAKYFCKSPV